MTDTTDDDTQAASHSTTADVAAVAAFTTAIINSANAASEPHEGLVVWPYDAQGEPIIQFTRPQSNSGNSSGDDPGDSSAASGKAPEVESAVRHLSAVLRSRRQEAPGW